MTKISIMDNSPTVNNILLYILDSEGNPFIDDTAVQESNPNIRSIKALIQLLVAAMNPSKIFMIEAGEKDGKLKLDLVIVLKSRVSFSGIEPLLELAYYTGYCINCSLHNEGSVMAGLRNGHVFLSSNLIGSNLVYDDGSAVYPITPPDVMERLKREATMKLDVCLGRAKDFYRCAVSLHGNSSFPLAMFMLHQSAEQVFRGILLCLYGHDKKTHEIKVLIKYVFHYARGISTAFEGVLDGDSVGLLDRAYISGRYEEDFRPNDGNILTALEMVGLLIEKVSAWIGA